MPQLPHRHHQRPRLLRRPPLAEFRAVNDPHTRISYYDVLERPDDYAFNEPIQRGKTIIYTRRADNRLSVAVADFSGRETFGDYPLALRLQARAAFLLHTTFEEQEKLWAAEALPKPYIRSWSGTTCCVCGLQKFTHAISVTMRMWLSSSVFLQRRGRWK